MYYRSLLPVRDLMCFVHCNTSASYPHKWCSINIAELINWTCSIEINYKGKLIKKKKDLVGPRLEYVKTKRLSFLALLIT